MLMLFACQTPKESREELSLAGCWELRLDSTDVTEQVQLPGTTDTNQKGYPNNDKEETTHLSRHKICPSIPTLPRKAARWAGRKSYKRRRAAFPRIRI